jgi:endonuclease/exonuclease/phosphatase family metal-dependent hydrolase
VPLLIRTWNLFHGNAKPPERHAFLEPMVRLAVADEPDVLCLQEVPVWALARLAEWSGMQALGAVAQPPRLGPLPISPRAGASITSLNHGLFRSAVSGQANAVLLRNDAVVLAAEQVALNGRLFRERQARWLGLGLVARLAWAKERRAVQAVRARLADGRTILVANLHATSYPADQRLADAEVLRAAVFADTLADPGDIVVLAGDFNVPRMRSATLAQLGEPEWEFSPAAGEGIDHVLIRGTRMRRLERWPRERRLVAGRVLSDHAPVDVRAA